MAGLSINFVGTYAGPGYRSRARLAERLLRPGMAHLRLEILCLRCGAYQVSWRDTTTNIYKYRWRKPDLQRDA